MYAIPPGLHGVHDRAELTRTIGSSALRAALTSRSLIPFTRFVLVDSRCAAEFPTRAAAALLAAGADAVLNSHSALALHGCTAADRAPIHVLVPYSCRVGRRAGVALHNGRVDAGEVIEIDGLRAVPADFALAEVLARGSRRAGIACADEMLRLAGDAEVFRARTEARIAARPDPRGRLQAAELLGLATGLPESPPESWTLLALVDGGYPPPVPQFRVLDISGRVRYRIDLAWPELRIAVEYDGYAAHAGREELDRARQEDLRRRGWIVIRATAEDLRDPSRLLTEVGAAFRSRGFAAAA